MHVKGVVALAVALALAGCTSPAARPAATTDDHDYVIHEDDEGDERSEPAGGNFTGTFDLVLTQATAIGITASRFYDRPNCIELGLRPMILNGTATLSWTSTGLFDKNLRVEFWSQYSLANETAGPSPLEFHFAPQKHPAPSGFSGYSINVLGSDDGIINDLAVRVDVAFAYEGESKPAGVVYGCTIFT